MESNTSIRPSFKPGRRTLSMFLAATLLLGGTGMMSGCYGTFPLTSAVYRFNGKVPGGGFFQSIVMIIFVIIPVYGVCMFVDAIVFNLIEFWSGETISTAKTIQQDDGSVLVMAPGAAANEVILTHSIDGETISQVMMRRGIDGTTTVYDENGIVLGRVLPRTEGGFTLVSADGSKSSEITPELIASLPRN